LETEASSRRILTRQLTSAIGLKRALKGENKTKQQAVTESQTIWNNPIVGGATGVGTAAVNSALNPQPESYRAVL
jgi:hypothetical protein